MFASFLLCIIFFRAQLLIIHSILTIYLSISVETPISISVDMSQRAGAPPPTTQAQLAERVRLAHVETANNGMPTLDKTYTREIQHFHRFINYERQINNVPEGPRYCTRENVDYYFLRIVSKRTVQPKTARRAVSAIQKFADTTEYIDGEASFKVDDSPAVTRALGTQATMWRDSKSGKVVDPHLKEPGNVMSPVEIRAFLVEIFQNNHLNWRNLHLSWNLGKNQWVRMDSARKTRIADTVLTENHGPLFLDPADPGVGRVTHEHVTLSWLLQKFIHKDNKKSTRVRQVGGYRHRDFLQCTIGAESVNLFVRFHYDEDEIHFFKNADPDQEPYWWSLKLLKGWDSHAAVTNAYAPIFKKLNISWDKVTHLRKQGIEQASTWGLLTPQEISLQSKHNLLGKIDCYCTEMYPPNLLVGAAFKPEEEYFLARGKWEPSISYGDYLHRIFPKLEEWRGQFLSPDGDKSKAAMNFLWMTLPYMALVVVQDGPFWLREFPEHEISKLLLERMPADYQRKSQWVRGKVAELDKAHEESKVKDLNKAACKPKEPLPLWEVGSVEWRKRLKRQIDGFKTATPDSRRSRAPRPPSRQMSHI
jgi:hypothetical protein